LGALSVALVGLGQAATGQGLITAEGGAARIRGVYGSPNNLALYLERALPLALAAALWVRGTWRKATYGAVAAVLGLATALTLSKGALLLGVPAGMAVVLIATWGRWGWALAGSAATAGLVALPILARLPRFSGLLDLGTGTSFLRVQLWRSAWRMFLDHPLLGVGPDNFLSQYRSRYILPEAWQDPNLSHPHNLPLDFLTRLGVLGFAAGLGMLGGFWVTAGRALRAQRAASGEAREARPLAALVVGLMGLVAAMLGHGLVDHAFFLVDLSFVFFFALAGIQHLAQQP
jgi:O-antigen ligase